MGTRFRLPMLALAIVLAGLLALLATLQYTWLGQISKADRERRQASLTTGAAEFAQDVDRELTRAYLLFQIEPSDDAELASRFGARYDQWQATSRFPRLIKDFYVFSQGEDSQPRLSRFDPASRTLAASNWPTSMKDWRRQLVDPVITQRDDERQSVLITRLSQPIWESVPAIVSPMPLPFLFVPDRAPAEPRMKPLVSYAILAVDSDYLQNDLLPALAERHFRKESQGVDFQIAVVRTGSGELVYSSSRDFAPKPGATADATADLFQVRTQEFSNIAAEVRRFTTFAAAVHTLERAGPGTSRGEGPRSNRIFTFHESDRPLSIMVQPGSGSVTPSLHAGAAATRVTAAAPAPRWKLMIKHPAGSLDAAVESARRRNLAVSMSVLGVLGASMGLLVLSTRRAQRLARQQMEFVAAVSHELRTPLAVIRSAAENLADGVVQDGHQIRKYGDLMRTEGRRLTEMVEQILELAGIQSSQRGFALRSVRVPPLLHDIISSSTGLIESAGMQVDIALPDDLPPVLADESALRRVFQNLIGNALKYGAAGGWIGLSAAKSGSDVRIVVADRGMGISTTDQARIFESFYRSTDAIEAGIQGAGLGLSLVQRIVEAHGGRVTVKSAPGTGSEFIIHLPAAGEEPVPRPIGAAQPAPAMPGGQSDRT
jgi:signal transduction histidine kinase